MLYRLVGSHDVGGLDPIRFGDVAPWAAEAVRWVTHDPDGTFRPAQPVTRAQLVRMLHRLHTRP